MAHQVLALLPGWYDVQSFGFRWRPPTAARIAFDDALKRQASDGRFFEDIVFRRDASALVMNIAADATSAFSQAGDLRLSDDFEADGVIHVAFNDGTADREWSVSMNGRDASEPYRINFTGDEAAAFNTFRGHFPTAGTIAGTVTVWDGQGANPFSTADTTPPTLVSAETTVSGAFIHLTYDEALDTGSTPANSAFALSVTPSGGVAEAVAIDGVAISGSTVVLTPASFVPEGAAAVLSYVVPVTNRIQDEAGNHANAFTAEPVTVRTDRTPPNFNSAATDAAGEVITLQWSETLDPAHLPATSAFGVQVAGSARAVAANGAAISGNTVALTLASAVANGETVTVAYTQPGSAQASTRLQDAAGNEVATFAAQAVTNNVPVDDSATDLVNITLTTRALRAADESWWRETDGVPAAVLRQDTDATITVRAFNYGNPFPARDVYADMPQLTADIESRAGEIVYETTDGIELFRFDFPAYDGVNATYQSPDQSIAGAAAFTAYAGDLVFRVTLGLIPVSGKGTAPVTLQPASLSVTTPDAVAISGKGNAPIALQAAQIRHTAPADVAVTGKGSAPIALQPAETTHRIRPVFVAGAGTAPVTLQPASLSVTAPDAVAISGKSNGAIALQAAALTVTGPAAVAISGKGRTRLRLRPATLTVRNPGDVAVTGKGSAPIALQAATTFVNRAQYIAGKGSAPIALQPAVASHRPAVYVSGKGSAPIALQPATLRQIAALLPEQARSYSAAHTRDLTRTSDLFALEITHPDMSGTIRIVADTQDIEIDGNTFTAFAFRAVPPTFADGEIPRAVLEVDNVGRLLTNWIEETGGLRGAMMTVMQVLRSPGVPNLGYVVWRLPALPVGVTSVTSSVVQIQLAYRVGRQRVGIKWRHDPETSPGLFGN